MSTLKVVGLQNPASPTINGTLNADGTTTFNGVVTFATGQTFPSSASTLPPGSPSQGSTWYDTGVTPAQLKVWNGSAWVPVSNNQSGTAPTSPTTGQQWTDTSTNPPVLKIWNGSAWIPASVAISNGVAPTSPVTGQLWSDTSTTPATLKAYNGTTWVPVQAAGSGGIPASLLTATGDMIYASAASTPARLGIGTAGQVLTVSGGVPAWTTIAAGGVTSVTGTAPIASSGGATPAISLTPGTARQLLQTNAGGTAAEFASNIDIPGTLDVTGVATFDGIASHPLGTAAAPSVTFTGDTDTGFYSPGAGRIGVANNGANTVEVTAAGNVLIGGTLPGTPNITLNASGQVLVGTPTSIGFGEQIQAHNTGGSNIAVGRFSANTGAPEIRFYKSRGSLGTNTIVANNDALGTLDFRGADGTAYIESARIRASVDGPTSANDVPGRLSFFTTPASATVPVEAMRINSSQNILIGGTLPGSPNISLGSNGQVLVGTSSTSSATTILAQGNSSSSTGNGILRLCVGSNAPAIGVVLGSILFGDNSHATSASVSAQRDGGTWTSGSSQPSSLTFNTTPDGSVTPVERMRIVNTGQTRIGDRLDLNPDQGLGGSGNNRSVGFVNGTSGAIIATNAFNQTGTINHMSLYNGNGLVGSITTSGSATAYNTSSDYRLKENVVPLDGAVDRLKQLPVHRFNFIADPDKTVDGFLAHEAQAVVPECVTGEKDAVDDEGNPVHQGIDQSKLVPLLTAALQEAVARIEALEAEVAALKGA